jgi:hypothetical protein
MGHPRRRRAGFGTRITVVRSSIPDQLSLVECQAIRDRFAV